jgi:hypothetical protein
MENTAESISSTVAALRTRAGLSMAEIAKLMQFKGASSYQRYEDATKLKDGYLKRDWVASFAKAVVGKGNPPVTEREVWELAGPEFAPGGRRQIIDSFDPDSPDPDPEDAMSQGEVTGIRGIPEGTTPQIDVTAGMGGGGLTIINEGVIGKQGMTFAAESISDWWRVPPAVLTAMGTNVKPTDITFIPVQGDSMAPTLMEGDVVVVDTRHRWPSPDGLYALNDAFGGVIVKRLEVTTRPGDDEQRVDVISDNPRHVRQNWSVTDVRIVGRVLRKFGHVL